MGTLLFLVLTFLSPSAFATPMYTYTLSLTPTGGSGGTGQISGTITFTLGSAIPASGNLYASQGGTIGSGTTTLTSLSVLLSNGVTYSLAQENSTANITFFNGLLSNFAFTDNGVATNLVAIQGKTYQYSTNGNYSGSAFTSGAISLTPLAVVATPEPSSLLLLGTGLVGLAGAARRRFRAG